MCPDDAAGASGKGEMKIMKRKKRKFWQPVVIGFAALYLVTMLLATYLVKEKYVGEYGRALKFYCDLVLNDISFPEFAVREEGGWNKIERMKYYQDVSNEYFWMIGDESLSVSAAFYDEDKNLLARSRDVIDTGLDGEDWDGSFILDDFLSLEEKKELAKYQTENIRDSLKSDHMTPQKYRFSIRKPWDAPELWEIVVQEITWKEISSEEEKANLEWEKEHPAKSPYADPLTGRVFVESKQGSYDFSTGERLHETKFYYQSDSRIVWEWKNPNVEIGWTEDESVYEADIKFPFLIEYFQSFDVYDRWLKWEKSEYLKSFPEKGEFSWEKGISDPPLLVESDGFFYRAKYQLKNGMVDDPFGYAEVRMEGTPWLAAMDYMKYIYLAGLVLTIACMAKVIYVFHQTSKKQAALEETRRDFINAMAHELKTPLGVIRNFAENLMEHNMEEKRDYYLTQIIGQTEEMDGLVTEMIGISKLESEKLELRKETVSFAKLIREQMERFSPMLREKNLQVRYEEKADFLVEGDREYLARAVWNLLSNAVDYNIPDGSILVRTEGERCIIENTGFPMGEDQLVHAFDLFYTEDQSRSKKERHMGMGLFLAKKILELHGMGIGLENTGDGVRVVISKK